MTPSRITPTRFGSNGQGHRSSDQTQTDELRLFERLARRDASALEDLYALYGGPIYSFALRTLGSREEAEEVLQDTFVRLWDKAASFDPTLGPPVHMDVCSGPRVVCGPPPPREPPRPTRAARPAGRESPRHRMHARTA